jgi:hypothetical protein
LFASIAKIDEVPHGVDKGIHTIHRDIDVVNLCDENESVFKIQEVLISPTIETFVIEFWVVSPSYNFDTLRIKAWKLHDFQSQLNKNLEKKKIKIDI